MITMNRLRTATAARISRSGDETGVALLSAIIFMILMAGISVVLLSVILGQIAPANIAQKGTRTIYAAQAGLQTSLGDLRSIATAPDSQNHIYGDPTKLPCSLAGNVDAQSNGITYSVAITYFNQDPTLQTQAWRTTAVNQLSCPVQGGTQPQYALLESTGHAPMYVGVPDASVGDRKLSAVYKFKISNVNIRGGRIFTGGDTPLCFEAAPLGAPTNAVGAGSLVQFVSTCTASATNDSKQLWIYDTDYEIKLASTVVNGAAGLCITGPDPTNSDNPQNVKLQGCKSDASRWNQLWSWTGDYTWRGQNQAIATGVSNYYLSGTSEPANNLQVRTGVYGTFTPSTAVGAGAASYSTHQLVNYLEFGRCADVTEVNIAYSYEISYPCKQDASGDPNSPNLQWNHKWFYDEPTTGSTSAPQQIFVLNYPIPNPTHKMCLQMPDGSNIYPTFFECSGSLSQQWVRIKNAGTYVDSYVMKDNLGRCLAVDTAGPKYVSSNSSQFSRIIVTGCNGSLAQKWNAPSDSTFSTVGGYKEVGG